MPFEHSSSLFEILRMMVEMFGSRPYYEKATLIHPPKNLLTPLQVFNDYSFVIFLINSLKSTWREVRLNSFELLMTLDFQDENPLADSDFINTIYLPKAIKFCNNPKMNLSEAGAFMLLLAFNKCMGVVDLNHELLPKP